MCAYILYSIRRYCEKFMPWVYQKDGAVAIEFALISLPFIFLMIGTIEMALMFGAQSVLLGATNDAARLIRTGQVQQTTGDPEQMFHDMLCNKADAFIKCANLQYEVIPMDDFSSYDDFAPQYDEDGNLISHGFTPGGVNSVNLIRVIYRYHLSTPLIGRILSDGPNNTRLLMATVVLETEPYDINQVTP